jgi:hypothetical protein
MYALTYKDLLVMKYPSRFRALLKDDAAFKAAAEKLAEKLAHALLENDGGLVWRRKNQSPALFKAAGVIVASSGVDVAFNDNCISVLEEE